MSHASTDSHTLKCSSLTPGGTAALISMPQCRIIKERWRISNYKHNYRVSINPCLGHTRRFYLCVCAWAQRATWHSRAVSSAACCFCCHTKRERSKRSYWIKSVGLSASLSSVTTVFCYDKISRGKTRQDNWSASMENCRHQRDNLSCIIVNHNTAESEKDVWAFGIIGACLPTADVLTWLPPQSKLT